MIVTDGKLNDASVRRALDTKYGLVMKKSNPIDVVFKDKAKFDTQNPIIGTLLTQIQLGKTNEKAIENQLKGAPSIKYLQVAELLERLNQSNRKNKDDDDDNNNAPLPSLPSFNPPPYYPPSSSIDEDNKQYQKQFESNSKISHWIYTSTRKICSYCRRKNSNGN